MPMPLSPGTISAAFWSPMFAETGTKARYGHAARRSFGLPHTPRIHSFPHIG